MSLILDALRKSERTRQQSLSGQLGTSDATPGAARVPVPWTTLLGLLLVVNAVVLGILFWRGGSTPPPAPVTQAAPAENTPAAAEPYRPSVRSLAEEAGAPTTASGAAPAAAPVQMPANNAPATPPQPIVAGNVPELASLPAAFQQSLPALHLDVHGYASDRAERFVVINLKRYHIGDTLAEGPQLMDITPSGAVLQYNGTTFLLPP